MEESKRDCIELLSKSECLQIVKNDLKLNDNLVVKSYKIENCSADLVGFMKCEKVRTLSYFIKCLPITNQLYRAALEENRVIMKESDIYENILPNIQRYSGTPIFPQSYLTRSNLMVLEDYSIPEKKLKQMREGEAYTARHHLLFMEHLAKLHAASLAWELKDSVDIGQMFNDILFELVLTTSNPWYTTGIKGILYLAQKHRKYQYSEAQQFINEKLSDILCNMEDYTKPSKTLRNVLCHRDSWDRNIFWEYDSLTEEPISCRIVDFQLTRYSPPAIDVLYYLCNYIQNPEEREEFLGHYHNSLMKELKQLDLSTDLITKEAFEEDCKKALLPVLINCSICEPLMKLPKGWSQQIRETEPEKYDYYMYCDRTEMFERASEIDFQIYGKDITASARDNGIFWIYA